PVTDIMHAIGAGGWTLEMLLQQAHYPSGPAYAANVRPVLLRLAAMAALHSASASRPGKKANAFELRTLSTLIASLPFSLTEDQASAVGEIASQIQRVGRPMFHVV